MKKIGDLSPMRKTGMYNEEDWGVYDEYDGF